MGSFIFYLHFTLLTSGLSGTGVLLGVVIKQYSDATSAEIGMLLMSFPFVSIIIKPLFCSMADRYQSHKLVLILSLLTLFIGYTPFIAIPFFPQFYENYRRLSYYILALSCHVGNAGLGVAWSLGDTLAVNISQRTGVPYSRMRLMGTVSWGIYGYLIGEINETPWLPKFVPGFLLLHLSVITEVLFLLFWNNEDFEMYDPADELRKKMRTLAEVELDKRGASIEIINLPEASMVKDGTQMDELGVDELEKHVISSTPSSLGGTLRCHEKTVESIKNFVMAEELNIKLNQLDNESKDDKLNASKQFINFEKIDVNTNGSIEEGNQSKGKERNTQVLMLRMLLKEDGRLIKYLIIYTIFGYFMAPVNFVFLSLPDVCKERDCNFSQLAGTLLLAQASIETLSFLVVPYFLARIRRAPALAFCFLIISARFFYYVFYYSMPNIPPYWAIVGEAGHGISYGIFGTILAETALMFANQSKLFIPELRRMGAISEVKKGCNELEVEIEENKIKMALRATMQSLFSGLMDGLGNGMGSLTCGLFVEGSSYIHLWQLLTILSFAALVAQQVIELSRSRWSDTFAPKPGTKASEIFALEEEQEILRAQLKAMRRQRKTTATSVSV